MAYPSLAAQLIVFGKATQQDPAAVLDAVAAAGFTAIECGPDAPNNDPAAFKALLDQRGLKVASVHGGLTQDLERVFKVMELYGTRDWCISGLGGWEGKSAERYMRETESFNVIARACAQRGFGLHYHNHAYEFAATDKGLSGMDLILRGLDVAVGDLCVDVAWVTIAGLDAPSFLREHAALVGYLHIKDYTGNRHWTELGQGVVPLARVFQAIPELPRVRWAAYEQDTSDGSPAASCATSYRYLHANGGW